MSSPVQHSPSFCFKKNLECISKSSKSLILILAGTCCEIYISVFWSSLYDKFPLHRHRKTLYLSNLLVTLRFGISMQYFMDDRIQSKRNVRRYIFMFDRYMPYEYICRIDVCRMNTNMYCSLAYGLNLHTV